MTSTNLLRGSRILFVISDLALGGSERQAIEAAAYLKDRHGAEVEIWGFEEPCGASHLARSLAIPCHQVEHPTRGGIKSIHKLYRFGKRIRDWNPDTVLGYTMSANIACGLALRFNSRIPIIWNQRDAGIHRASRWAERIAVGRSQSFISNGKTGAEFLTHALGVPKKQIHIIANGVKLDAPQKNPAQWRQELGIEPSESFAVMIGHLSTRKSHQQVLESWAKANPVCAKLICVGRNEGTLDQLKELVSKLEITNAVRFSGFVEDIPGILNAASFLIHAAPSEGCPNAVIEGLSAGLPLVLSDTPGVRDIIPQGQGCWICKDTKSMSHAITQALSLGPVSRDRISTSHKKIAESQFNAENSFDQLAHVILKLIENERPCARSFA